ncbi:hypothetical protein [Paenibacillus oryzae]|nr:hypothetical protein [Paenibacillus oryzae]
MQPAKPTSTLSQSPGSIRFHAAMLVLFFLNVFVLVPVLAAPAEKLYMALLFPPLIVMNLWALLLILLPAALQRSYILFRGIFGVVCSLSLLIVMQKFAYSMLELNTPFFALGTLLAYGIALYDYIKRNRKKKGKQTAPVFLQKSKKDARTKSEWSKPVAAFAGLGYLASNVTLGFVTQQFVVVVLILIYGMLSYTVFHFMMELRRYISISRYPSL